LTQARAWVALALDAFEKHETLTPPASLEAELTEALGEAGGADLAAARPGRRGTQIGAGHRRQPQIDLTLRVFYVSNSNHLRTKVTKRDFVHHSTSMFGHFGR